MKKSLVTLAFTTLAVAVSLTFGLMGRQSVGAKGGLNLASTSAASATTMAAQTASVTLPGVNIYALTSDNMIYVLKPGTSSFAVVGRVPRRNGNLIGIDFRPAEQSATTLYGLTDTGNVLLINLASPSPLSTTVASTPSPTPRFAGGFQSLMDFNPVVNALRVIGSNDQNFAFVNSNGGNLNAIAVQTAITYDPGDVNKGVDPNLACGSYTNNYPGAPNTIFYGIDYDLDTFVTISSKNATGSSNTGGGMLQTIGSLVRAGGGSININPTADIDIYTDANGVNTLVGVNNEAIFTIDLTQLNPSLALGATQNVVANVVNLSATPPADAFIDIAIPSVGGGPAPAPAPTPAPTPAPAPAQTTYQAENAVLGGGAWVMTNHVGFTGTGFADFADGVAGSFVEFTIAQTGARTLIFRFSNGSGVARAVTLSVNGKAVGTINFPTTANFDTWATFSQTVNLAATPGSKVRLTAATTAGGPNLDKVDVQ